MSEAARKYLKLIGASEESSLRLTKAHTKAADELRSLGFAELIPISTGGCWVALTSAGVAEYEKLA